MSIARSLFVDEREAFFVELLEEMVPANGLEVGRSLTVGELEVDHSSAGSLCPWHVCGLTAHYDELHPSIREASKKLANVSVPWTWHL
jgi:hypothetical protein